MKIPQQMGACVCECMRNVSLHRNFRAFTGARPDTASETSPYTLGRKRKIGLYTTGIAAKHAMRWELNCLISILPTHYPGITKAV